MTNFIPIETPGGIVFAEIDAVDSTEGLTLTGIRDAVPKSFHEAVESLRQNAQFLIDTLTETSPEEIEVSFGIKIGAEAGIPIFGLAKASGEASYVVTLKWKSDRGQPTKT